jgi:hypothetical protein
MSKKKKEKEEEEEKKAVTHVLTCWQMSSMDKVG